MIGRIAYGTLFVVAIPLLLVLWSWRLDHLIDMPRVESPIIGASLLTLGIVLMAWSMQALWVHGRGLPMNAFPPPRFVTKGPYRWTGHPIYVGFVLACFGVSVALGSQAGFWLISPLSALACAALVLGYERVDLARRFGADRPPPAFAIPPATDDRPGRWDVASVIMLVYLPWLALYEMIGHVPVPDPVDAHFAFEHHWPVIEWTEIAYGSIYLVAVAALPLAASRRDVRQFMIAGWAGTLIGMLMFLVLPINAPPREFLPETIFGHLLLLEQADGVGGRNALPSFHVFWALMLGWLLARRGGGWALTGWAWASAVTISTVTTGMHAVIDLPAGIALFLIAIRHDALWSCLLKQGERIANSWTEWRLGPMRVLNHGFHAGAAAFVGMLIAGTMVGRDEIIWLMALALTSLIGAGVWGQVLVGSKTLQRPFGYFGSVLGIGVVVSMALFAGTDLSLHVTAIAIAAPWVQLIGRGRCLVQGCCHGAALPDAAGAPRGIRYHHPRSRVCSIAKLAGIPVHPTPIYSMLANAVIGLLLFRLWTVDAPGTLIIGLYLILSGMARFVEESYRGEPQTPIVSGLRLYQWLALGSIFAGTLVTALPPVAIAWPPVRFVDAAVLLAAALVGVVHFLAMGVDVPGSERRGSRLV